MNTRKMLHKNRIWEIDAIRGYLILWVLLYHLYFTVEAFCINGRYHIDPYAYVNATDPLQLWFAIDEVGKISPGILPKFAEEYLQPIWVCLFFVISGISCMFSRDNLKRGIRVLAAGFLISAFTYLVQGPNHFIRFGVLHCYGCCQIIYDMLLQKRSYRTLMVVAVLVLALGYYLHYAGVSLDTPLLYPFGVQEIGVNSRDYWPIFPMLGWFLLGVIVGRKFYAKKQSLISGRWKGQGTRWLQFLGRHSGLIYIGHVFIYTAVFMSIGWIFDLF